jgi:8-oxo-dGTP pyrophosphatase MutT (NUDIX family)
LNEDQKKFLVVLEDNGYWELPGGGLDFPETPEEGLRREIKEEMGLIVTEVAKRPSYVLIGENMKGVKSINIVYEVKVKDLNFTPSDECVELKFISPNEIDTINAFRNVKELAVLMGAEK